MAAWIFCYFQDSAIEGAARLLSGFAASMGAQPGDDGESPRCSDIFRVTGCREGHPWAVVCPPETGDHSQPTTCGDVVSGMAA